MLPNFLIIGVPRGGTTWLQANICTHPEIFMPSKKEIHFFDRHYEEGIHYYEQYFKGIKKYQKAIGEATPDYLHIPEVPKRIYKHLGPNIKFILLLRNPVDRLYSRFWNAKTKFKSNRDLSFEEKIEQKPQFIEEGYYIDHIERYLQYYTRNQFLFLLYEDIKKNPETLQRNVYTFLGIDPSHKSPLFDAKINSAKSRPSIGKNLLLYYSAKVVKKLGWKKYAYKMEKSNAIEYTPMNPDTKKWLTNEVYREKNQRLQDFLGMDISHWNKA